MQGRAGYFFTETLGIELVMSQNTFKPNSTFDNINTAGVSAFYNYPVQYSGGMLMWSPFYSKINTFDSIIYLDWIFGIGYASITTEDNRIDAQASTDNRQYTTDSATGILLNIGMRIYLSKSWSARIDLTPLIYSGFYRTPGTGNDETQSYKHYDLTFGFNYAF
jgi:outer membrane beta-barrel protein